MEQSICNPCQWRPDVISTSIPARQEVGREGKRCAVRSYPGY